MPVSRRRSKPRRRRRWPRRRTGLAKAPSQCPRDRRVSRASGMYRRGCNPVPHRPDGRSRQGRDRRGRRPRVGDRAAWRAGDRRARQDAAAGPVGQPHAHRRRLHRPAGAVAGRDVGARPRQRRRAHVGATRSRCRRRAAYAPRLCVIADRRQRHIHRAGGQRRDQRGGGDRARRQGEGERVRRRQVLRHVQSRLAAGEHSRGAQAGPPRPRPHSRRHASGGRHRCRLRRDHPHQLGDDAGDARQRDPGLQRDHALRGTRPLREGRQSSRIRSSRRSSARWPRKRIYSDPTMAVFEGLYVPENGDLSPAYAPFLGTLPPTTERNFRSGGFAVPKDLTRADYRASWAKMVGLLGKMQQAGIPIVAGTDGFGIEIVRELEIYVEAGLSPAQALAAATIVPARLVRQDAKTGGQGGKVGKDRRPGARRRRSVDAHRRPAPDARRDAGRQAARCRRAAEGGGVTRPAEVSQAATAFLSSAFGEREAVERRRGFASRVEGSLHPRAHLGHVVAGKMHAAVRLAERRECVMRRGRFRSP